MQLTAIQTRRQHLATLAITLLPRLSAAPAARIYGAQLNSLRRALKSDPDKILREIAAIGYREVEVSSRTDLTTLAPRLKQSGLAIRSCPTETPLITKDWELYPDLKRVSIEESIETLKNTGVEYFLMGDISSGARGDGDDFYRRTADRMNAAAEACRKNGLKFAWPIQGFAFEGRPGLRPLEILHDRLDPKLAPMELDAFRVSLAGLDPAEMLKQWKGRVANLRLLDKPKGTPTQFEDSVVQGAMADLGDGALDLPAILKAAQTAGVRGYLVSQAPPDDSAADPLAGLRKSFEYLKKLG